MKKIFIHAIAGILASTVLSCSNPSNITGLFSSGYSSDPASPMVTDTVKISGIAALSAQHGLKVVYQQSDENIAIIEAPADLLDKIALTDKDKSLTVATSERISSGREKVTVTVKSPSVHEFSSSSGSSLLIPQPYKAPSSGELSLSATSGSCLNATELQAEIVGVDSSSGASIRINATAQSLACEASSGSLIIVEGVASAVAFEASSGASVNADRLKAETGEAQASSGGAITCFVNKMTSSKSSSGGSINNLK